MLRNYLRGREVVVVRSKASGRQTATLEVWSGVGGVINFFPINNSDKFHRWCHPVSALAEVKMSFIEPGRRWAHSPYPSKAPGISYQGTMKTSVIMLKTSGGL